MRESVYFATRNTLRNVHYLLVIEALGQINFLRPIKQGLGYKCPNHVNLTLPILSDIVNN
jgi:hypothetical protein